MTLLAIVKLEIDFVYTGPDKASKMGFFAIIRNSLKALRELKNTGK